MKYNTGITITFIAYLAFIAFLCVKIHWGFIVLLYFWKGDIKEDKR